MFTVGGEANCGALGPIGVCAVQAGVAALVLDSHGLDGDLTVREGGTEPDPSLVRRLDHGIALLGEGGHVGGDPLCRVSPCDLLHLFGQTIGAGERNLLAAHCRLVLVASDLC